MLTKSHIKLIKSLQQKKYRDENQCYIAEGIKIVNEAITYHCDKVIQVISTKDSPQKISAISKDKLELVEKDLIEKLSSLKTPQSCLVLLKMHENSLQNNTINSDVVLALESVRDPGNMGTIIRLADWFGISQLVCSTDCVDCYNPKVVQASMGAILRMSIIYEDLPLYLKKAKENNIRIYGTTLEGSDIYTSAVEFPSIILFGNESEGISTDIRKLLTNELFIPNFSSKAEKSESLNVSMAASIILSEFMRRKNYSK